MRRMELPIGEHWYLAEGEVLARVLSGKLDIFAEFASGEDRFFLQEINTGDYCFARTWDTDLVGLFAVVRETVTLACYTEEDLPYILGNDTDFEILRQAMVSWFQRLGNSDSLQRYALRNMEGSGCWLQDDFLNSVSPENLWADLCRQQQIFSYLCVKEFSRRQEHFYRRIEKRQKNKAINVDKGIELLAGERPVIIGDIPADEAGRQGYKGLVERAAKYFGMEETSLVVPDFLERNPDDWEYLKFLLRKQGIRFRKVLLEKDCFRRDCGVFLICIQGNWVLALPEESDKYLFMTGEGNRIEFSESLIAKLEPGAYQLYGGLPNRAVTNREFLHYWGRYLMKTDVLGIVLSSIVIGLIPLLIPLITESVFSDVVPIHDYFNLAVITRVLLISGFTTAVLTAVRSIAVNRIVAHLNVNTEGAIWSRLLTLPVQFFKKYSVGELLQRVQSVQEIRGLLNGSLVSGIFNVIFSFWSLALMFYYSAKLTFCCIGIWLLFLFLTYLVYRGYPSLQRNLVRENNLYSTKIVQIFNGLNKFRSRGGEEEAYLIWSSGFSKIWKIQLQLRQLENYSILLKIVFPQILFVLVLALVGFWTFEGSGDALSSTRYMAFVAAYSGFNAALINMVPQVVNLLNLPIYLENLQPILSNVPEAAQEKADAGELYGEIELSHVSFAYNGGPLVLKDISLRINPGEKVAIVGPSGCGKSTLLRIILGFEVPNKGIVAYDGKDLSELNSASVRRQMGVVMQEGKLLSGSILSNIVGSYNLTIDDAWEAVRMVALDKDIEEMPMGMQTVINDSSSNISGGQRQRILLARSIVNHPAILVLDEATSALDNTTQNIVMENLNNMQCTQLIVAHRLSTIGKADRIIVLKDCCIAETGTFEELLAKGGIFTELASRQLV